MSWSDERVALLKKRWGEGRSGSQIAKELGGVTRNAVIGKVHRLGLSNRSGPDSGKAKTAAKAKPAARTKAAKATPVSRVKAIIPASQPRPPQPSANEIDSEARARVNEIEKKARKLTLMELTERTCKWPVGDPATDDFWFCGLPAQAGKPYCEAHAGVAFKPMVSRRHRRR